MESSKDKTSPVSTRVENIIRRIITIGVLVFVVVIVFTGAEWMFGSIAGENRIAIRVFLVVGFGIWVLRSIDENKIRVDKIRLEIYELQEEVEKLKAASRDT